MRRFVPIVFVALLASSCNRTSAAQTDAQKAASALSGDDKLAAANNPQCKMFKPAEVAKYIGQAVSDGRLASMGLGCQWLGTQGSGRVIVTVVPERYFERPSLAKGFREVPDAGTKGFVAEDLGGWVAGAIVGENGIRVAVAGAAAGEASALALLKETIKRRAQ
jgi:hypothetical protein